MKALDITQPKIHTPALGEPFSYTQDVLDNGIEIMHVLDPKSQVLSLDILIRAGRVHEVKKCTAKFTAQMLKEGCRGWSSAETNERIERLGTSIYVKNTLDHCVVKMKCLSSSFTPSFDILKYVLLEPNFSEVEISHLKKRALRNLHHQKSDDDLQSYRLVTEMIYGSDHPYGYNTTKELINNLERQDILNFYHSNFTSSNISVVLSGYFDENIKSRIREFFEQIPDKKGEAALFPKAVPSEARAKKIVAANPYQSSLKIARSVPVAPVELYAQLLLTNMVFGGFFGSRLMKNIRELKGMTYSISSSLETMLYDGLLCISTDTSNKLQNQVIEEIYKEMDMMCKAAPTKQELAMAKNYTNGVFLSLVDGCFKQGALLVRLSSNNKSLSHFYDIGRLVQEITLDEIHETSKAFLNPNEYALVVLGQTE